MIRASAYIRPQNYKVHIALVRHVKDDGHGTLADAHVGIGVRAPSLAQLAQALDHLMRDGNLPLL